MKQRILTILFACIFLPILSGCTPQGQETGRHSKRDTNVLIGSTSKALTSPTQVSMIKTGIYHTCALLNNGTVKCWGRNYRGQLGYGDTQDRDKPEATPIDLGTGRTAKQLSLGSTHTCALLDNDTVKCWGGNMFGQLGYGDTQNRHTPEATPVDLGIGRTAKQIAAGIYSTCAVLDNDTVKCWGDNYNGQLGYGDTQNRHTPGATSVIGGVKQISVGISHACALMNNGTTKCWGSNNKGQLGYGDTQSRHTPGPNIALGGTAQQISVGVMYTCALLDNGTVKCWGYGSHGQLGYGNTLNRDKPEATPVNLGAGRTAKQISLWSRHTCAVLDNDTIKCWGYGYTGQLGYNDQQTRNQPDTASIDLGTGRTATQLSIGNYFSCAVLDDGTAKCWGQNFRGQLGYGDTQDRYKPDQPIDINPPS